MDPRRHDVLASLRALSIVLDLANGLREDKSLATALFAHALAQRAGADEPTRADAFFAALLRHLGCTSYAHHEAELVEDDVALRRALATSDATRPADLAHAIAAASPTTDPRPTLALLARGGASVRIVWAQEACGGARALADAMGFGEPVLRALGETFERFDGKGAPHALEGEAISLVGRVSALAHAVLSHHVSGPSGAAREALTAAHGEWDPKLARLAIDVLDEHPDALLAGADDRLAALAPSLLAHVPDVDAITVACAFGDFGDLQSRYTRGHSRGVASLVALGAERLGLDASEAHASALAAHLHDLGAAAVPTRIWETRDTWSIAARERARMHVYYTERALLLAPPLAAAAPIAGAHHERLDANGYHRGLGAERIPVAARLLAVADVLHALGEDRPHRAALSRSQAKDHVARHAKEGALDARVLDAVIDVRPSMRTQKIDAIASLTPRERSVLRLVAMGRTNKEIGTALGISDRTVQTHTLHVYEKLGVDTRAAAAVIASRAGVLG